VSANSTTSALCKPHALNRVGISGSEGVSGCTKFAPTFLRSTRISVRGRLLSLVKQFLDRILAWVHIAHADLTAIVSRHVLQRERFTGRLRSRTCVAYAAFVCRTNARSTRLRHNGSRERFDVYARLAYTEYNMWRKDDVVNIPPADPGS
jgi:hypothetical protein